jgi:hypothetical protein
MKYLINVFFILVLCMSGSQLLAFGNLSADEVRTLITGNTVEGERRQGVKGGQGEPGMVDTYAEIFTMYFAEDGTVKRLIDERRKKGKWRVTESGKLCLEWKGKKERCASVYKSGNVYKRATKKSSGRVLWEIKFIRFTPGNEYDL